MEWNLERSWKGLYNETSMELEIELESGNRARFFYGTDRNIGTGQSWEGFKMVLVINLGLKW